MSEASNHNPGRIMAFKQSVEKRLCKLHQFYENTKRLAAEDDAMAKTPGITYHFIMGFIPFMIFLINVILKVTAINLDEVIYKVYAYAPEKMADTLAANIERIITHQNDIYMYVSLAFYFFEFTLGLALLVRSTDVKDYESKNESYPSTSDTSNFIIYCKAFIFSFLLIIVIVLAINATVFSDATLNWLNNYFKVPLIISSGWYAITYIAPFVLMILFLTLFYLIAPSSNNTPPIFRAVVVAVLVTFSWIIITVFYRFLLMLIPGMGESYGPLFGLFIMFIWLSFISKFIMAGIYIIKSWEEISSE